MRATPASVELCGVTFVARVLGVSPMKLFDAAAVLAPNDADAKVLDRRVRSVEPLGAGTLVVTEVSDVVLTARAGGDSTARAGDAVRLFARPADVHLFDVSCGLALEGAT
jgi:ABC-type sugar transport system ATPase subunit